MSKTIVVAYDASDGARKALDYALNQAKSQNAAIVVAHVLEWSPYSFLTPEEIEERHKRRTEELERAHSAVVDPVLDKLKATGVSVRASIKYGHIAETICKIATEEGADQIVIGRTGHSGLASLVFGSVAGTLAQASPVPVTIVP